MAALKETEGFVEELKKAFSKNDLKACDQLVNKIKSKVVAFPGLVPGSVSPSVKAELTVAQEGLEYAVKVAAKMEDKDAFQRNFSMLQTFYSSAAEVGMPPSAHQNLLLALHLMSLLVENRTAEFHMELELLPREARSDKYISHVIQVEQWMMDGAYNNVSESKKHIPDPAFGWLTAMLMSTVRSEVASCIEQAYHTLKVKDAQELLMVDSEAEVSKIAEERGWKVLGGVFQFKEATEKSHEAIPTLQLITNSLMYARELERIV